MKTAMTAKIDEVTKHLIAPAKSGATIVGGVTFTPIGYVKFVPGNEVKSRPTFEQIVATFHQAPPAGWQEVNDEIVSLEEDILVLKERLEERYSRRQQIMDDHYHQQQPGNGE